MLPISLILVGIFTFYATTIRAGHVWDDDAAMNILHARNIAEGRPYADTGYIFNPEYARLGPSSYLPGFPLLIAPIETALFHMTPKQENTWRHIIGHSTRVCRPV